MLVHGQAEASSGAACCMAGSPCLTLLMQLRFQTGDRNLRGADPEGAQWGFILHAKTLLTCGNPCLQSSCTP